MRLEGRAGGQDGCLRASLEGRDGCSEAILEGGDGCTGARLEGQDGCTGAMLEGQDGCTGARLAGRDGCTGVGWGARKGAQGRGGRAWTRAQERCTPPRYRETWRWTARDGHLRSATQHLARCNSPPSGGSTVACGRSYVGSGRIRESLGSNSRKQDFRAVRVKRLLRGPDPPCICPHSDLPRCQSQASYLNSSR